MREANNLCIGDWVQHQRKPVQLRSVYTSALDEDRYGVEVQHTTALRERLHTTEIDPIPLTTEILLANGWEYFSDRTGEGYERDGIRLYPYRGDLYHFSKGGYSLPRLRYVHTLQRYAAIVGKHLTFQWDTITL